MASASFWRGAWYCLDDHLFPNSPATSAAASLGLGVAGLGLSQGLVARAERLSMSALPVPIALARFGALYTVAMSCVLVWRGTWVGWDCLYEHMHPESKKSTAPGHATQSGLISHVTAVTLLLTTGLFASVLAPPAAVSVIRDFAVKSSSYQGPGQRLVTQLMSKRSISTKKSKRMLPRRSY